MQTIYVVNDNSRDLSSKLDKYCQVIEVNDIDYKKLNYYVVVLDDLPLNVAEPLCCFAVHDCLHDLHQMKWIIPVSKNRYHLTTPMFTRDGYHVYDYNEVNTILGVIYNIQLYLPPDVAGYPSSVERMIDPTQPSEPKLIQHLGTGTVTSSPQDYWRKKKFAK